MLSHSETPIFPGKRKIILTLLFAVSMQLSFGQTYHSFPDSNAVWTIATIDWGNYIANKKYGIIGDTLISVCS